MFLTQGEIWITLAYERFSKSQENPSFLNALQMKYVSQSQKYFI